MRKALLKLFFVGIIPCITVGSALAQKYKPEKKYLGNPDAPYIEYRAFSLGVTVGATDLWADVGTESFVDHYLNDNYLGKLGDNLRFMGGVFVRYTHNPGLAFRLGVNYGSLYATDRWNEEQARTSILKTDDAYTRYRRNLDVHTNIWEGYFLAEISPLRLFSDWELSRLAKMRTQPYILLGVGAFHFNPKGTFIDLETGNSRLVDLPPLHTEGQGFKADGHSFPEQYGLYSYAAIAGIGVKWDIGNQIGLGIEWKYRYTFTDYLDDVSGEYVDPVFTRTAYNDNKAKGELAARMADRSSEVVLGHVNAGGTMRGDPDNTDRFSSINIMFFWKIKPSIHPWWKTRKERRVSYGE